MLNKFFETRAIPPTGMVNEELKLRVNLVLVKQGQQFLKQKNLTRSGRDVACY